MHKDIVKELGKRFGDLFYTGHFDTNLDFPIGSLGIEDAYRVQDEAIAYRRSRGEAIVGYKVGCTLFVARWACWQQWCT